MPEFVFQILNVSEASKRMFYKKGKGTLMVQFVTVGRNLVAVRTKRLLLRFTGSRVFWVVEVRRRVYG
jgi:hypothetical protein